MKIGIFYPLFFKIKNGLKQTLLLLLSNLVLDYAVRTSQDYSSDVNLIDHHIRTIERNSSVLLNACKDIGLAVNAEESTWTYDII